PACAQQPTSTSPRSGSVKKTVVNDIGIGLQMPLETLQKLGWPGTLARRCVVVNHSLMIPVSDIRPDPSCSGMRETPVQYFHRRVVRSDHFGGQHKVFQARGKEDRA